jgi:hypothetical protein
MGMRGGYREITAPVRLVSTESWGGEPHSPVEMLPSKPWLNRARSAISRTAGALPSSRHIASINRQACARRGQLGAA